MARWMTGVVLVFIVVYAATVLLTGQAELLIPVLILAALLALYAVVNLVLTRRKVGRDGSLEAAMADNEDPVPSAHIIPDDTTAVGDTPEAHDEISPHDLPVDHPGRPAAEEEAAQNVARGGTNETRGDEDPSQAGRDDHGRAGDQELGVAHDDTVGARSARDDRFVHEGDPQAESAPGAGTTRGPRTGG